MLKRTFYGSEPGQGDIPEGMTTQNVIGEEQIDEAITLLMKYKQGKVNLERRIIDDEKWWKLRHWETINPNSATEKAKPSSAWLVNAILNKHADAMDNYPEPIVLPRERSDEQSAKTLQSILPVIMETNDFQKTYSDNWYKKLKHGTAAYGVFWNSEKDNGLGDVDIKSIDLLSLFWEPGITDIQKSQYLFITELVDNDILDETYPQFAGMWAKTIDVAEYVYDDTVDTSDKSVVVDMYYKSKDASGRTVLQFMKFCGRNLLYASENDPMCRQNGWYQHGEYPIVFDNLYPEEGTPVGWGYIALCKEPQMYIDQLSANVLENTLMSSKKRFFVKESMDINEDEFADWNKQLIHVSSDLDDRNIKEFTTSPLDGVVLNVMQMKVEEMKETASNRDVNSGSTGSGVTAAAAIAALQEAGNKASRDMIFSSYNAYSQIIGLVTELIRQFYDEPRTFRITGTIPGSYDFVQFSNAPLQDQVTMSMMGEPLIRKPILDYKVKAQKKNPFSRMEQNERAKELYSLGFFNPENAQPASVCLDMMEFEGIEAMKEKINQGATLLNMVQMLTMENAQLKAALGINPMGVNQPNNATNPAPQGNAPQGLEQEEKGDMASGVMKAQKPMTSYGESLAKRSVPSVE